MAREILVTRTWNGRLAPVDPMSAQAINDLPVNKTLGATIRQKRNLGHHRKFYALIRAVFPHQVVYATEKGLVDGIKMAVGHTREVIDPRTMETTHAPDSISFEKMDQEAFEQFYDRAVSLIRERIIPQVDSRDLEREVLEIMEGRQAA